MREFGFFFFFRMAVAVSSVSFLSAPEGSLQNQVSLPLPIHEVCGYLSLEVDLLRLGFDMLWFRRHGRCCDSISLTLDRRLLGSSTVAAA